MQHAMQRRGSKSYNAFKSDKKPACRPIRYRPAGESGSWKRPAADQPEDRGLHFPKRNAGEPASG
eukprot:4868470-Pyramimonas_sp.AAC.1